MFQMKLISGSLVVFFFSAFVCLVAFAQPAKSVPRKTKSVAKPTAVKTEESPTAIVGTTGGAPAGGPVLTWDDCVREMAQSNPDLRSSLASLRSNEELAKAARSGFFPALSANVGYSQSDTTTTSSTASTTNSSGATVSTALNLTQNIFNGLSDYEKVESAKRQVRISELNLQNAKAKALLDLRTAYVNYVTAKKNIDLADYIVKRRDDNLKMVELRFESGRENKGALLLSQTYLEQARFDKFQSTNAKETAAEMLARAMGRESGTRVEVSTDVAADNVVNEPVLTKLALDVPDYQISQAQEDIARINLKQSRSAFSPTLNLNGSIFGSGPDIQNQSNHWSVGLALAFPLFNGGKDYYSNSAASYGLQSAMLNQGSVLRQTIVKLQQAYVAWVEAVEQSRINQSFLNAHKVRATISRDKYNNGLFTFDQWDQVENDLIKAEKDYLTGLKTRWINEATWKQVQGFSNSMLDEALK